VRVGPVLGDEVTVLAQQSFWWYEEASESAAREQSCEPRQHRSICWLQRRSVDLTPEDCQLVAQHDDLDGEIRATATDQSDELQDTAERPVEKREDHSPDARRARSQPSKSSSQPVDDILGTHSFTRMPFKSTTWPSSPSSPPSPRARPSSTSPPHGPPSPK